MRSRMYGIQSRPVSAVTRVRYSSSVFMVLSSRGLSRLRATVEVRDLDLVELDPFEAAHVDGGYRIAFRVAAVGVGMDAARRAEAMPDDVLVELVDVRGVLGSLQLQRHARHEPEER